LHDLTFVPHKDLVIYILHGV